MKKAHYVPKDEEPVFDWKAKVLRVTPFEIEILWTAGRGKNQRTRFITYRASR